jgi:hypothetical protein
VLLQFIDETTNKSLCRVVAIVIAIAVTVGSSHVQNNLGEVMSNRSVTM